MHRLNTRRAAASIACLIVAGSMTLTACVLPPDPNARGSAGASDAGAVVDVETGGALAIPESWPTAVPLYDSGTLTSAESDPSGTFLSATWDATATPDAVATEYGDLLVAAGLTAGTPFVDDTSALNTYTGSGLTVTVYASIKADGDGTEVSVTVEPTA